MTDEPQSIRTCFAAAESLRTALQSFPSSSSSTYQENLASAIAKYQECVRIAAEVSLFSANETLEDVSSGDIQYLTLHFHIASLLLKSHTASIAARSALIRQARAEYDRYLKQLDNYDILSKAEARLYEQLKEAPDTFSTASTTDAATRRGTKIARFKEEKALKEKMAYLRSNPASLSTNDAAVRDLHLTNLALCTYQTFADLEGIAQEIDILSLAPPPGAAPTHTNGATDTRTRDRPNDGYSDRVDTNMNSLLNSGRGGPILSSSGRPLKPFTLLDSRQRLQQGVFRPDHNLPTMSIDEYLEEEKRRGGIIEGGGAASGIKPQVDEDDYGVADAATMKARNWDDFKDENPRGAGNTMNVG